MARALLIVNCLLVHLYFHLRPLEIKKPPAVSQSLQKPLSSTANTRTNNLFGLLFWGLTNCFLNGRVRSLICALSWKINAQRQNNCPSTKHFERKNQRWLTRIAGQQVCSNWFGVCFIKGLGRRCAARAFSVRSRRILLRERRDNNALWRPAGARSQHSRRDASFKTEPAKNNNARAHSLFAHSK